jgi:peptidyl-prolyl cis-trans isomerase A (cyclophilin A)
MSRRFVSLALLAACTAAFIACKEKPSPDVLIAQAGAPPDSFRVAFETSRGRIVVEITRAWAPLGADRFFELVSSEFFDEERFYRVVPGFIAQFGANDDKTINAWWDAKPILDDPVRAKNVRGTIAYAKAEPNSRSHQLFINLSDNTRLDTMGFAPIGRVVEGMSVADSIYSGYGEKPDYNLLLIQGNNYLRRMFPKLDYIKTARVVK